ncbi:hypothetical protein M422DRAFT_256906 [Sphaerobolus stellatus SS14]|uniref:Uncharacterized protein n=1 Tax=Sphaerobolus stellatus (strain SS14) TaxID=990650 RepID=A0A0C9UZT3_SPHS4|nr:hypothetical protein M422DRAFT_256906 [Sphaerobolus stellatus SS14]
MNTVSVEQDMNSNPPRDYTLIPNLHVNIRDITLEEEVLDNTWLECLLPEMDSLVVDTGPQKAAMPLKTDGSPLAALPPKHAVMVTANSLPFELPLRRFSLSALPSSPIPDPTEYSLPWEDLANAKYIATDPPHLLANILWDSEQTEDQEDIRTVRTSPAQILHVDDSHIPIVRFTSLPFPDRLILGAVSHYMCHGGHVLE